MKRYMIRSKSDGTHYGKTYSTLGTARGVLSRKATRRAMYLARGWTPEGLFNPDDYEIVEFDLTEVGVIQ